MELYINMLICKIEKLMDKGSEGDQYASSPQIFTIISRHMENCQKEDCICKKYEPEYDKKFSSNAYSSRRLTKRISSNNERGLSTDHRRKMPIKIAYKSKCQIFMAEVGDCMERFLQSPQIRGGGVGLKLQKSYFYHTFMDSSFKALFVQLENSYSCNYLRGKIHIYHLKTRI